MSFDPSALLRLYMVDDDTEEGNWDNLLNDNLSRIEEAGHGIAPVILSGADVTLDDTAFTGTESHKAVLQLSGLMVQNCNIIVPARQHIYHVLNDSSAAGSGNTYTVTVKTAAGTGVALTHGDRATLVVDGTNVREVFRRSAMLVASSSLSDVPNKMEARLNLGLGSAAELAVGVAASNVVQLDSLARLPAVDGSQLVNVSKPADVAQLMQLFRAKSPPPIANAVSDSQDTHIDIGPGSCVLDDGSIATLATKIVKRIDQNWQIGSLVGGLDAGSRAANQWYAVFLIKSTDETVVDVLISAGLGLPAPVEPVMPAGWTRKRRIGWIRTDASSNITRFWQDGDCFRWKSVNYLKNTTVSSTASLLAVPSPPQHEAMLLAKLERPSFGSLIVSSTIDVDVAPDNLRNTNLPNAVVFPSNLGSPSLVYVKTDQQSRVRLRATVDTGNTVMLQTLGWRDARGRDD